MTTDIKTTAFYFGTRGLKLALSVIHLVALTGCSGYSSRRGLEQSTIPVQYKSSPKTRPVHALTLAILPTKDLRQKNEGTDSAYRYTYRGKSYRFTDLRRLRQGLSAELSGHLAQSLHRNSVFAKIVLVNDVKDARDADLILYSEVKRARGYVEDVEIKAPNGTVETSTSSRKVLSEFVLENLRIQRQADRRLVFDSDFGWSIYEDRSIRPEEVSTAAFEVLSAAISHVLDQFVVSVTQSDLSGNFIVRKKVAIASGEVGGPSLTSLAQVMPDGWNFTFTSSTAVPLGWNGGGKPCSHARAVAIQSWKFHRAIGPYRPTLNIWACHKTAELDYLHSSSQNAEYLGVNSAGMHYFVLGLGETNWKNYRSDLRKFFKVTAPSKRHVFRIRPAASDN